MSVESNEDLRKLRDEKIEKKIEKKFEHILSKLNEKERDLEKCIENLEEKLVARRFEERIREKQDVIVQLASKKSELERKLEKLQEGAFGLEKEKIGQKGEGKASPIVVRPPKLDLDAIRKMVKGSEKKRFWKFSS